MKAPVFGHLLLHVRQDAIPLFSPLLQKGFFVQTGTGNLQELLCRMCQLTPSALKKSVQTVFLNGKPVDDMATVTVHDGDCLALSAAMPGLVGATMRSGGILAGFRHSISHRSEEARPGPRDGILMIKLFNLLIKELGPVFLKNGILIGSQDLHRLLMSFSASDWQACSHVQWNDQKIQTDTLASMEWPKEPEHVILEVAFG